MSVRLFAEFEKPDACIKSGAEKYSVKSVDVDAIVVELEIEIFSNLLQI